MIFNSFAIRQTEDSTVYYNFATNEWTRNFNLYCLASKAKAEMYQRDLVQPSEIVEMNVSVIEASCQNCDVYNDIAHDCEFYVGYANLDNLLSQAIELIKRGTKQSTEGLEEGIQYNKDVNEFLKQFQN